MNAESNLQVTTIAIITFNWRVFVSADGQLMLLHDTATFRPTNPLT